MLKALVVDVDGTLTGHATKPLDAEIKKHLESLQSAGVKVGVATSHLLVEDLTARFADYYAFDFMILESGSIIYTRGPDGGFEKLSSFDRRNRARLKHMADLKRHLWDQAGGADTGDPLLKAPGTRDVYDADEVAVRILFGEVFLIIRPVSADDSLLPLIARLQTEAEQRGWAVQFIEPGKAFVTIGIANKGEAVRFLARHLGIPLESICAIGDSDNDREMLSTVGLPACPADVTPELRDLVAGRGGIVASEAEYHGTRQVLGILTAPGSHAMAQS